MLVERHNIKRNMKKVIKVNGEEIEAIGLRLLLLLFVAVVVVVIDVVLVLDIYPAPPYKIHI